MTDIKLHVRPDATERLTVGDVEIMERITKGGEFSVVDVIRLLEKVLEDDPRALPLAALPQAVRAVSEAMTQGLAEHAKKG